MPFISRTALRAAVAAGDVGGGDRPRAAVRVRERRDDVIGVLLERDELGVPLHVEVPAARRRAPRMRSLSSWPSISTYGNGLRPCAHLLERDARAPAAARPHVGAVAAARRARGRVGDAELRVDLERAGVHRHRPGLLRRAAVAIDDHRANAAAAQLVGEHQPGRARRRRSRTSVVISQLTSPIYARLRKGGIRISQAIGLNPGGSG